MTTVLGRQLIQESVTRLLQWSPGQDLAASDYEKVVVHIRKELQRYHRWTFQDVDLEDLAADVISKVLTRRSRAEIVRHPVSYLNKTIKNAFVDWVSRRKSRIAHEHDLANHARARSVGAARSNHADPRHEDLQLTEEQEALYHRGRSSVDWHSRVLTLRDILIHDLDAETRRFLDAQIACANEAEPEGRMQAVAKMSGIPMRRYGTLHRRLERAAKKYASFSEIDPDSDNGVDTTTPPARPGPRKD